MSRLGRSSVIAQFARSLSTPGVGGSYVAVVRLPLVAVYITNGFHHDCVRPAFWLFAVMLRGVISLVRASVSCLLFTPCGRSPCVKPALLFALALGVVDLDLG